MRVKFFITALFLCILAPAALAADSKERLAMDTYPGEVPWHEVTNSVNGDEWLREQIPSDQKIETHKDLLSAQAFPKQRDANPSLFLKSLFSRAAESCERIKVNGPKEQTEDGFAVAYAQIYCGKQKGAEFGVNMFFKAIKGDEALYVIEREFRVPPTSTPGAVSFDKDQMQQVMARMKAQSVADSYLVKSVYLCGAKSTDPRCGSEQAK